MTEIELIIDLHLNNERQGSGNEFTTKKALDLTGIGNESNLKIADIGCGTGSQTITLANNTNSHITAVDLFSDFLEKLTEKAKALGIHNRIETIAESMDKLSFEKESLDLIWSEGAIYNMGFNEGTCYWNQFLKQGGCIAVSELSWLAEQRPPELESYWKNEYPQIDTVSGNIKTLEKNGYSPIAHFIISPECWIENYYNPLEIGFEAFLKRHNYSDVAKAIINNEKKEVSNYLKYKEYYGYGFYIAQKL